MPLSCRGRIYASPTAPFPWRSGLAAEECLRGPDAPISHEITAVTSFFLASTPARMHKTVRFYKNFWSQQPLLHDDPFIIDGFSEVGRPLGELVLNIILEDITRKLSVSTDSSLLEVGCGAGPLLRHLEPHVRDWCGTDISATMLSKARESLSRPNLVQSEANMLPFKSWAFDRVLCYSVFRFFPHLKYARNVLDEMVRTTKPGGLILVGDVPDISKKREYFSLSFPKVDATRPITYLKWIKRKLTDVIRFAPPLISRPVIMSETFYPTSFFTRYTADRVSRVEVLSQNFERDTATLGIMYDVVIHVGK